jgi:WxL domain surface cell wall-binding
MKHLRQMTGRRLVALLAAGSLLGIGLPLLLDAGTADAATASTCPAGSVCTITGTLALSTGILSLTTPDSLSWTGTVTGADQHLVDLLEPDQTYQVTDARGDTTAGWAVNVAATTFTGGTSGFTLPDTGTFSTDGSETDFASATAPTAACTPGSTCTLPTNSTTYPVAITTGTATPSDVYTAAAGTGLGVIDIGSVGWWLNVPGNAPADVYTSTITMQITSGP